VTARRWLGAGAAAVGIAGLARWRRALTMDGTLAAAVLGTVVFGRGGWSAAAALNTFFVSSSVLSRAGAARRARLGALAQAKGAERDAWQVLANGGAAGLALLAPGPVASGAFLGAVATAAADTWATELGLLAGQSPRLVTSLRRVPAGTSGGVTAAGLLASAAGAAAVGFAALITDRGGDARRVDWYVGDARGGDASGVVWRVGIGTLRWALVGVLGALVDSVLGATLQARYWCTGCQAPTEHAIHPRCRLPGSLVGGQRWVTNDVVNALATTLGALLGATLTTIVARRRVR
jgi:uncharacterized protein (TIGR00297 family)